MPIPRPAQLHFNSFLPPIKKKKKLQPTPEPTLRKVEVSNIEFDVHETSPLSTSHSECCSAEIVDVENCLIEKVDQIFVLKVLFCEPTELVDTVSELPTKPPTQKSTENPGSCRKHSRCHCNLFSKETEGFFALPATIK